jgi:hypothetical protein
MEGATEKEEGKGFLPRLKGQQTLTDKWTMHLLLGLHEQQAQWPPGKFRL